MTTFEADRQPMVEMSLPERISKHLQRTKDFVTETTNNLTESVQQARESVTATAGKAVHTVTHTTDKAVDIAATAQRAVHSVTAAKSQSDETIAKMTQQAKGSLLETVQQTKSSLGQTLQTAQQLSSKTSEAIQTGINSSADQWLQAHPAVSRLVQLILWAADHPIVSLVILLFGIAIAWSFIKAIGRSIDAVGWSLLQAPLRLAQMVIRVGWRSLGFKSSAVKQLALQNTQLPVLVHPNYQPPHNHKQRLAEIATRLEAIQKEQCALLQEAATILDFNKIDLNN